MGTALPICFGRKVAETERIPTNARPYAMLPSRQHPPVIALGITLSLIARSYLIDVTSMTTTLPTGKDLSGETRHLDLQFITIQRQPEIRDIRRDQPETTPLGLNPITPQLKELRQHRSAFSLSVQQSPGPW
jgi:hypothetical protein